MSTLHLITHTEPTKKKKNVDLGPKAEKKKKKKT